MSKYVVKVYIASWSFITHADHYDTYHFESSESIEVFSKRLARNGFSASNGTKWILPGAIMEVVRL